jgi:hypothetical protein
LLDSLNEALRRNAAAREETKAVAEFAERFREKDGLVSKHRYAWPPIFFLDDSSVVGNSRQWSGRHGVGKCSKHQKHD